MKEVSVKPKVGEKGIPATVTSPIQQNNKRIETAKVSRTTLRPLTSVWCFEMIYAVRCSSDPSLDLDLPICSQQSNISVSCFNKSLSFHIFRYRRIQVMHKSFWIWLSLSLWKEITPVPTFLYHRNPQQCLTLDLQTATSVSGSSAAVCDTSNKRMKWLLRGKKKEHMPWKVW